jgi:hypothetical protein
MFALLHLVCYPRDHNRVFETYWTKRRGAEVMDYNNDLRAGHRTGCGNPDQAVFENRHVR